MAGTERGRRLKVAPGGEVRPTSEKVREAIFDVLGPVNGATVLDLFAGTGAMGLEALSRGAGRCVFVENDPAVAAVLRQNIGTLGREAICQVIVADYQRAVADLAPAAPGFDLLFVDPPYRMLADVEAALMPWLASLSATGGLVVVEGDKSSNVTLGQTPVFERTYGDTRVAIITMRRSDR